MRLSWWAVVLGLALALESTASTIHVPGDHATLADAVASASPGDLIEVAPGTYSPSRTGERFPIDLTKRDLVIRGAGAGKSVLDGEGASRLFRIGPGSSPALEGFTLSGGFTTEAGGAILVEESSPRISQVHFTGNEAGAKGDALAIRGGESRLTNCLLEANGREGPTVLLAGGAAVLSHNTFHGNGGISLELREGASPRLTGNIFSRPGTPSGAALGLLLIAEERVSELPTFEGNLFAGCGEGPLRVDGEASPSLERAVRETRFASPLFDSDSLFVAPLLKDFRIREDSPARDLFEGPLDVGAFAGRDPMEFVPLAPIDTPGRSEPEEERLLGPSVPNPFTPSTTIHFNVRRANVVVLAVYDLLGRRVRSLHAGHLEPGDHTRVWDGRDNDGLDLPPGAYFVRVTQGRHTETRRVVLVR